MSLGYAWWRHAMEKLSTLLALCVRGIHRLPVDSPHKGQISRALMFSFILARLNCRISRRVVGDLRRYDVHYDVISTNKLLRNHKTMRCNDLNQFSLFINDVLRPIHFKGNFSGKVPDINHLSAFWDSLFKRPTIFPNGQWINYGFSNHSEPNIIDAT